MNYDPAKAQDLLILDKHPETGAPGHNGVAWCKNYGEGRVSYTSPGHREDIRDADPGMPDRKNSPETAKAYQAHILAGIEWAARFEKISLTIKSWVELQPAIRLLSHFRWFGV